MNKVKCQGASIQYKFGFCWEKYKYTRKNYIGQQVENHTVYI